MQTHHILFVIWFAVVGVWLLNQFNRTDSHNEKRGGDGDRTPGRLSHDFGLSRMAVLTCDPGAVTKAGIAVNRYAAEIARFWPVVGSGSASAAFFIACHNPGRSPTMPL